MSILVVKKGMSSSLLGTKNDKMNKAQIPMRSTDDLSIRIKGHLGQQWMNWFEGLTITLEEDGNTLLSGICG
jgi:hypothetical protein